MTNFNVNIFLANRKARRSLNTLIAFTVANATERQTTGNTHIDSFINIDSLNRNLSSHPKDSTKILNEFIDQCLDVIQDSPHLAGDTKKRLLDALESNPNRDYYIILAWVGTISLILATIGFIAWLLEGEGVEKSPAKLIAIQLVGIIAVACFIFSWIDNCAMTFNKKIQGVTTTEDNFIAWANNVAQEIIKLQASTPVLEALDVEEGIALTVPPSRVNTTPSYRSVLAV